MVIRGLLAVAMATALGGCVSPVVKPDPFMSQPRVGDAQDWQLMAKQTVAAIPMASNAPAYNVYVATDGSAFGDAYKAYLEKALYDANYGVLREPDGADFAISFDVQAFNYYPGGKKRLIDYATFAAGAISGLGQFRNISSIDTGFAALTATGVAADVASAYSGATNAEVLVTSRITSERTRNFHFVGPQTFYVRPVDLGFYIAPPPGWPVVPLRVSGR
ncbi:MAG TPA: hypothetical protein VF122_07395 [Caulobacteraceae bacterium]